MWFVLKPLTVTSTDGVGSADNEFSVEISDSYRVGMNGEWM